MPMNFAARRTTLSHEFADVPLFPRQGEGARTLSTEVYSAHFRKPARHCGACLVSFRRTSAKELARPSKLPALPGQIPPGLPIDLLRRRPDIHAAERQLAAATARIGVAMPDLFPRVIVSGALGGQGGPHSSKAIPITFIGRPPLRSIFPCLILARSTQLSISTCRQLMSSSSVTNGRY
jgi:hypothetical protein